MISNKNKENALIIFAKKPELGKVKTRIAEETSKRFAYEFSKVCLVELVNKIKGSDYYDVIVAADDLNDLLWFQKNFSLEGMVVKWKDGENKQETQSNKFENIFSILLSKNSHGYKKVILIPMDIPFISQEDVIAAFARLDKKHFVLGPEINGGVYLIGAKIPYKKGIFKKVRWSTSHSFEDLVNNTEKENTFSLKLKNDLNMPGDILRLRDEIYHNCSLLYEFLERNSYYLPVKNRYINFDDLLICLPVVSNIVQRQGDKETEILIQTRYKPSSDPDNTGKIEIPSGLIKRHELAQDAALRETKEESGITAKIAEDQKVIIHTEKKDGSVVAVYRPFCCHQQLKGGRAYLSIAFISDYIKGSLDESFRESRDPRWVTLSELKKIVQERSEDVFILSLGVLKEYLKYKSVN